MSAFEREGGGVADFTSARYDYLCGAYLRFMDCRVFTDELGANSILLRHDVDVSVNRALALAKIEENYGIRATYFFDPLSSQYSIFDPTQRDMAIQIAELGHVIGLHFDASRHAGLTLIELEQAVRLETQILEAAGVEPVAISFHNPRPEDLELEDSKIAGLVNAYSRELFREAKYVSDSNGFWKYEALEDLLRRQKESRRPLQVLIHPEWWQEDEMPPRRRFYMSSFGRFAHQVNSYDRSLRNDGRHNLSGIPSPLGLLIDSGDERFENLDLLWNLKLFVELKARLIFILNHSLIRAWATKANQEWQIPSPAFYSFVETHQCNLNPATLLLKLSLSFPPESFPSKESIRLLFEELQSKTSFSELQHSDDDLVQIVELASTVIGALLVHEANSQEATSHSALQHDVSDSWGVSPEARSASEPHLRLLHEMFSEDLSLEN